MIFLLTSYIVFQLPELEEELFEKKGDIDESVSKFTVKESVMHPKYGVGRIISIEGTGDNIKLTIGFGLTKRVFMEKYTPLQKLN